MAICILAVGLVYLAGVFYVPHSWIFGAYDLALKNICYVLLGLFFLIYAAYVATFRWTTILFGAAFGYLAGVFGQHLAMMAFEPQRWIYLLTHHGWKSVSEGSSRHWRSLSCSAYGLVAQSLALSSSRLSTVLLC